MPRPPEYSAKRSGRHEGDGAEPADVAVVQVASVVEREVQGGVGRFRVGEGTAAQEERAGEARLHDDSVARIEVEHDELGAPPAALDRGAGRALREARPGTLRAARRPSSTTTPVTCAADLPSRSRAMVSVSGSSGTMRGAQRWWRAREVRRLAPCPDFRDGRSRASRCRSDTACRRSGRARAYSRLRDCASSTFGATALTASTRPPAVTRRPSLVARGARVEDEDARPRPAAG